MGRQAGNGNLTGIGRRCKAGDALLRRRGVGIRHGVRLGRRFGRRQRRRVLLEPDAQVIPVRYAAAGADFQPLRGADDHSFAVPIPVGGVQGAVKVGAFQEHNPAWRTGKTGVEFTYRHAVGAGLA